MRLHALPCNSIWSPDGVNLLDLFTFLALSAEALITYLGISAEQTGTVLCLSRYAILVPPSMTSTTGLLSGWTEWLD